MTRVVFDVRANHDTGVSRYGLSLLPAAAREIAGRGWELDVVIKPTQWATARDAIDGLGRATLHVDVEDHGFLRRSATVRELAVCADVFYTANYLLDRACPIPFVMTIHDLTRMRLPEYNYTDTAFAARFGAPELSVMRAELDQLEPWQDPAFCSHGTFTRYFVALTRYLATRAARIVTVSGTSARDLRDRLGLDPATIEIVPGAVDTHVFRRRSAEEIDQARRDLDLPGPYLLFVGLAHPHKRLEWLVEQLLAARRHMPPGSRLVAVGGHAERSGGLRTLLSRAATDFMIFPGRVSDDRLAALYSGAAAFVSASVSEGYGLPAQEALSCGCEVITAEAPAVIEISGPTVHRFPCGSGRELSSLACRALRGELSRLATMERAGSWGTAGREVAQLLGRVTDRQLRHAARIRA